MRMILLLLMWDHVGAMSTIRGKKIKPFYLVGITLHLTNSNNKELSNPEVSSTTTK
jgi:hypothetical protein